MTRSRIAIAAVFASLLAAAAPAALAQTPGDSATAPKASKMTTRERINDMMSKWRQNRPKLAACRKDARKKGLAGDDRWFFISNCMEKS